MSIVTKKGDEGRTALCGGRMVLKDHARIEANGALDELCSYLGMSKSLAGNRSLKDILESIQHDLFVICAEIATDKKKASKLRRRISAASVARIEGVIREIESRKRLKGGCFYLPGENHLSSALDVSRTVARRAERRIVTLRKKNMIENDHVLIYLNRLSDLLYLLARCSEKKSKRLGR